MGFARSKAQAMHPEIACNNNYDDHYANDREDVHLPAPVYEIVMRGMASAHTSNVYTLLKLIA
jgi:hypothetical protein